ncbi:MazG-like family protein [Streptomyces sp. NPDC097617]|uniref:MazG-like family protein n=1 Tax=Streptomyces sp. NPDC097617 TaxID=3366091 RepID=UPI00382339DE
MDPKTWQQIEQLRGWLDKNAGDLSERERILLRVLKINEEAGEVAEAVHGALGGNPRKGASHSWADVEKELCDVIVTASVALASVNPEAAAKVFENRLQHLVDRVIPPAPEG